MFNKKTYIFLLIWLITILIAIIWTFENSDKVQLIKNKLKENKTKIANIGKDQKINSAYYLLNLKKFKIPVYSKYGGIDTINNKILYVSGESEFFLLEKTNDDENKYEFNSIKLKKINNNKDKFIKKNEPRIGKNAE